MVTHITDRKHFNSVREDGCLLLFLQAGLSLLSRQMSTACWQENGKDSRSCPASGPINLCAQVADNDHISNRGSRSNDGLTLPYLALLSLMRRMRSYKLQ